MYITHADIRLLTFTLMTFTL